MISDEELEGIINSDVRHSALLVELAKELLAHRKARSEPVAEVTTWWPPGIDGGEQKMLHVLSDLPEKGAKLFARPAPVINLAELVPDENEIERIYSIYCTQTVGSKNALRHIRNELLRKIEEVK